MKWLLPTLLMTAAIAGCVSDAPTGDDSEPRFKPVDDPIPVESETHDHRDPLQHLFAKNAALIDHDDLRRFGASEELIVGSHVVDVNGDILVAGVFGDHAGSGQNGFHVFRVQNGSMEHLSFFDAGVPVNGDRTIALSDDAKTVFLGYEGGSTPGVGAIDISDPTTPKLIALWADPTEFGSHTVAQGMIGGEQYVFSLALGVNILKWTGTTFEFVGKYVTNDEASLAGMVTKFKAEQPTNTYFLTYGLRAVYGHDMNFYHDPTTDTPLLLVAYGYDGAKILDISQPSAPVMVGRWLPTPDSSHEHYTHSITAERIGDQFIVVVGSETFEEPNQVIPSPIWILDATEVVAGTPNPVEEPMHLGTWTNPGGAPAGDLGLSVHFFRQLDGYLYLSHYHGGVWALDLNTPEGRSQPQAFGYIMPVPENAVAPPENCCIGFDLDGVPMVFDVAVADDHTVYIADIVQGVLSAKFTRP